MSHDIQKPEFGRDKRLAELGIALGVELIRCLPQIIENGHDFFVRMLEKDYRLDIKIGGILTLKLGKARDAAAEERSEDA